MRLRTIGKLGVILSIILFCIGVGFYSFAQFSFAEKDKSVDLLALVPSDCVGVLETDNIDFLLNELPQTAYAGQLDTLQRNGLLSVVWDGIAPYTADNAHGLHNQLNYAMISFHAPVSSQNVVMYFRTKESEKNFLYEMMKNRGMNFTPKKESYRGKTIEVFPVKGNGFISAYTGKGFLAISYQKSLIEKVIDAEKDGISLRLDEGLTAVSQKKSANFITLYGRTASFPLLTGRHKGCWSEFDIHLSSEVFYLSGSMYAPDSCMHRIMEQMRSIPSLTEDSVLILSGQERGRFLHIPGIRYSPTHVVR